MSKHPDREQTVHIPGPKDGILPFPLWFRNIDRTSNGLFSGIVNTVDVLLHGESGRERFNPKNVLLQTGIASGIAVGTNLAASVVHERLLDKSSAIVYAQELGLEQATEEVQVAGVIAPTEPAEPISDEDLSATISPPEVPVSPAALTFEQRVAIERELRPIYEQFADANGILIKAPNSVNPTSLEITKKTVELMLNYRADIKDKLIQSGVQVAIIPKDMTLTQLPEFTYLTNQTTGGGVPAEKVRGIGANTRVPVTAYGEEELLQPLYDSALVHEFGHAVMNLGFSPEEIDEINYLFNKYKSMNIFGRSYSMRNAKEFMAVMSQIHFHTLIRDPVAAESLSNGMASPEQLREAAPDVSEFLEKIYGLTLQVIGK